MFGRELPARVGRVHAKSWAQTVGEHRFSSHLFSSRLVCCEAEPHFICLIHTVVFWLDKIGMSASLNSLRLRLPAFPSPNESVDSSPPQLALSLVRVPCLVVNMPGIPCHDPCSPGSRDNSSRFGAPAFRRCA